MARSRALHIIIHIDNESMKIAWTSIYLQSSLQLVKQWQSWVCTRKKKQHTLDYSSIELILSKIIRLCHFPLAFSFMTLSLNWRTTTELYSNECKENFLCYFYLHWFASEFSTLAQFYQLKFKIITKSIAWLTNNSGHYFNSIYFIITFSTGILLSKLTHEKHAIVTTLAYEHRLILI